MSTGDRYPVVVVGAGPAGLAVARELSRRGLVPLVLERTPEVGDLWAGYYDRLKLNTPASTSYLPGRKYPRAAGSHPHRDRVVEYLRAYAHDFVPHVRTGVEVAGVTRAPTGRGWLVTGPGLAVEADAVILATGSCAVAHVPDWPGRDSFSGRLVHSSAYQKADAFRDRSVLVVGGGNSAFDIALDSVEAGAREVFLSVRSPAHLLPPKWFGVPIHRWVIGASYLPAWVGDTLAEAARRLAGLHHPELGFPQPADPVSVHYRKTGIVPVANSAAADLLRSGKVKVVAAVSGFEGSEAILEDGSRLTVEEVVAATGFRRSFASLTAAGKRSDGIHVLGFTDPLTGNLREIRHEARAVARAVVRSLG